MLLSSVREWRSLQHPKEEVALNGLPPTVTMSLHVRPESVCRF